MIHSLYGPGLPSFQVRRPEPSSSPSSSSIKPTMRNIFRNRRANSESGPSGNSGINGNASNNGRPGPEDAGPSTRPAPIEEERTSPVLIPAASREVLPPGYSSQIATAPIPSYEAALGASGPHSPRAISGFLGDRTHVNSRTIMGTSSGSRSCAIADEEDTDEDDPLVPRMIRPSPALNLVPLPQRRATFAGIERPPTPSPIDPLSPHQLPMELPRPPANALPAYSPHLLRDELRLISAVHLDQTHPAAAFFNHIATNFQSPGGTQREQLGEMSTGSKKLKLVMTRGAERMNINGTGPMFLRLPRGGDVAGRIEVGKVDHATQLEVSIIGLVNTSYYIRGQYTLIDTLPLCRRQQILYPPAESAVDATTEEPTVTVSANGIDADPVTGSTASTANGTAAPQSDRASTSSEPAAQASGSTLPSSSTASTSAPASQNTPNGKEPQQFVPPNSTFEFALRMPNHHYRDSNVDLPPTSSIFQVGMQASVEYVLRIKLTRKGWRLNETITVPLIYEPRAYVNPRRLRALTTDDAMNPGWRTIKLHGGEPAKPVGDNQQGVSVSLLLPSPPIVYVPWGAEPPPIPFHLHFHSSLTHALATFSDPTQCQFVIRLMRVASMRIGAEREIRRMEVPAKVEIWQEGGPKILLGEHGRSASSISTATAAAASTVSPTSPTVSTPAASGGRRPSVTGAERRQSFFRRLSLDRTESREQPPLQRQQSNAANASAIPPVAEEPESAPASNAESPAGGNSTSISESPTRDSGDSATAAAATANGENPVAPLSLSSTDVHFLGQLTISCPPSGPELLRRLVQSYMTPEIGVTYVLEVGLQPNAGSVKEAFKHVWGGGMVEVVLGARPAEASGVDVNLRPEDTRS